MVVLEGGGVLMNEAPCTAIDRPTVRAQGGSHYFERGTPVGRYLEACWVLGFDVNGAKTPVKVRRSLLIEITPVFRDAGDA